MGTSAVQLIVVHGIGDQKVGTTVARWAGALERLLNDLGFDTDVVKTDITQRPAKVTVEVRASENDEEPVFELRLVEAHWADAFPQPSPQRVLRWLFVLAPGLAFYQAIALVRAATVQDDQQGIEDGRSRVKEVPFWPALGRAFTSLAPLGIAVLLLALALPLVLLLLATLLLVSVIPVESVRKSVASILGLLSSTIGDAFLFIGDPVSRAAMVSRLHACLDEATKEADDPSQKPTPGRSPESVDRRPRPLTQLRQGPANAPAAVSVVGRVPVIVLAHSQGAAVAYRALSRQDARLVRNGRVDGIVTVGSAVGRLHGLGNIRPRSRVTALNIVALTGYVVFLTEWFTDLDPPVLDAPVSWAALVLAIWATVHLFRYWLDRVIQDPPPKSIPDVDWLDVWAPTDLVPNGRRATTNSQYRHLLVPGELSITRDHTRYADDYGQTLPALLTMLLTVAYGRDLPEPFSSLALPDQPEVVPNRAASLRLYPSLRNRPNPNGWPYAARDLIVAALRAAPIVAALAVLVAKKEQVREFGHWTLIALPDGVTDTIDTATNPIRRVLTLVQGWWREPPTIDAVVAVGVILGFGLLAALVIRRIYAGFTGSATRTWLGSQLRHRWGVRRWTGAVVLLALVSAAACSLLIWSEAKPRWTPEQLTDAYTSAVATGDWRRLCDTVGKSGWDELDPPGPSESGAKNCKPAAKAFLRQVCTDARAAYPEARMNVPSETDKSRVLTETTWLPEPAPTCGDKMLAMLLPHRVDKVGSTWRITSLCTARKPVDDTGPACP